MSPQKTGLLFFFFFFFAFGMVYNKASIAEARTLNYSCVSFVGGSNMSIIRTNVENPMKSVLGED